MAQNPHRILGLLGFIRGRAISFIEASLAREGIDDLLVPHGSILAILFKHGGPMTVSEIVEKSHRGKSTITELLCKMERNGYVTKLGSPEDQRVVLIDLTPKARKIQPAFNRISKEMIGFVFRNLSAEETETFLELANRMAAGMED